MIKLNAKGISGVIIQDAKIKYLLVDDAGKAKGFEDMGYSFAEKSKLEDDLVKQLGNNFDNAIIRDNQPYGVKYEVSSVIIGPNGKQGRITVVWQIDHSTNDIKIVTAIHQPFN